MNKRRMSRRHFLGAACSGLPAAALAHALWLEPGWLKVRHIRLSESPRFKLAHVTDIHHKGDRRYLEKIVSTINRLAPDVICFTGDLIDDSAHLAEALELLQKVNAPLFGVPGNHDYWASADFDLIRLAFASTGGAWLMDQEATACGGTLHLAGFTCSKPNSFSTASAEVNVALIHYPSWVSHLEPCNYDLVLAGHSHGGQVRLPLFGSLLVPFNVGEFDMGLYHTAAGPLYVNPGLGYFFLNIRFFCRPEITLFHI
jgi:uncharacterized protein